MKRVYADQDGAVIAVHDPEQNVPADAYAAEGRTVRVFDLPDDQVPKPELAPWDGSNDDLNLKSAVIVMPRLSAETMATYLPPVPAKISSTQGKLTLLSEGLLDQIETAIGAITDAGQKRAAQIKFDAADWRRADPLFDQLGGSLNPPLVPARIDELFRLAAEA